METTYLHGKWYRVYSTFLIFVVAFVDDQKQEEQSNRRSADKMAGCSGESSWRESLQRQLLQATCLKREGKERGNIYKTVSAARDGQVSFSMSLQDIIWS